MNIRSITYFMNPGVAIDTARFAQLRDFVKGARDAFESNGYAVQSARLATVPFPLLLPNLAPDTVVAYARALETAAADAGCSYVALGPALPDVQESYDAIPPVLAETENTFMSGVIASPATGVSLPAVRSCARVIQEAATLDPNGFGNLYFTALANVAPGGPFFPAAYHEGDEPCFALAMEAAGLAVQAFKEAGTLAEARQGLIERIECHARTLSRIGEALSKSFGVGFNGIDFTLAPFPAESESLGTAIERLGVASVGLHGSLAGAAFIADALDRAHYPKVGFNGLMLPVLEDSTLAKRAAEGTLSVKDLLMYSAVCGTGLDTVPLPGDTSREALACVLLDVAALAQRLAKPLTARLMPIPGKGVGDPTSFDFPFFANSRVLAVDAAPLTGLFAGDGMFDLAPRISLR